MTGMFISRNLKNVGQLIAIYSLKGPENLETSLTSSIFENATSLGKTKSLSEKLPNFIGCSKNCQIRKKSSMGMAR